MSELTRTEFDGLETVEWGVRHFGSALTGRTFLKRTAKRLAARGLIRSRGLVCVCDADGFIRENCQMREGWEFRGKGREALAKARAVLVP